MLVVGAEPPTACRRNVTGVLWVLTGTHLCDDDPTRQGSGSPERQLVPCVDCIVWLLVHCEVVKVNQIMLFATLYVLYLWATVHTPRRLAGGFSPGNRNLS